MIKLIKIKLLLIYVLSIGGYAQTTVTSLSGLRDAVQNSNQQITLVSGEYQWESLPEESRVIDCSGSDNTIDLTGVRILVRVGSIREAYFNMSGNNNVLRNGIVEDYYQSGLEEVTDFSAYNNDRTNLAYGLKGDPIMSITGDGNLVEGLEMIVKGSFPYGYGSQYGIGAVNTFGLSKRCGILITGIDGGGVGNTLDGVTMHHYAFGHGIFMQNGATETVIKNCYIEGRMRQSDDIYNDTETYDLPYLTDYKFPTGDDWRTLPFIESYDIPRDENSVVYPLSEDGIRAYNDTGSVIVENCTVKQMRGGIRLYLASSATVTNSVAIDCGNTNYNMPADGSITGSSGNFSFAPLSDFRLSRSRQNIEMTILPSANAIGTHNLADVLGNNHNIVFHRSPGPLDDDEERSIVVSGSNSTIVNETEYSIILESTASGNTIISCGDVTDNGSDNNITLSDDCFSENSLCGTEDAFSKIEAEAYCFETGIVASDNYVEETHDGDWIKFDEIDFGTGANIVEVLAATTKDNGVLEIRQGTSFGTLLGSVAIGNTNDWGNYEAFSSEIESMTGKQENIYFVFTGDSGFLFNLDTIQFSKDSSLSIYDIDLTDNKVYPNPFTNEINVELNTSTNRKLQVFNTLGQEVYTTNSTGNTIKIDADFKYNGLYILKITEENKTVTKKLIKK